MSRYINRNKGDYYRLLQKTRDEGTWEEWVLFMLEGVEQTSLQTTQLIKDIKQLMLKHKTVMREKLPKIYSQDLLNNIFRHPYTKIDFVINELGVSKPTAIRYLDELCIAKILYKHKMGKESFYINTDLYNRLMNIER